MAALGSGPAGLSAAEAASRLAADGPNRLPEAKRRSALARFLAQFDDVLIYVLLAAAVVTALLREFADLSMILLVVVANAVIGFVQEGRAERALEAIRDMISPHASVLRDGARVSVPSAGLVRGDIVLLEAGDRVPADLRLVQVRNLRVEEAALTGESVPVEKSAAPVAAEAALADRSGMAFFGTLAVAGQATGVVVATGAATELGRISTLLGEVERLQTPLVRQMAQFGRQLTIAILLVAAAVWAWAVAIGGMALAEAFMVVVGLAVAAIPEGLPAIMTITLAIGVRRMARRNAIVRVLPAIETLGSVSVICSDKTGTFTRNEMAVRAAVTTAGRFEIAGVGYSPEGSASRDGVAVAADTDATLRRLARAALLCNDAEIRLGDAGWSVEGDPMEGALVAFAGRVGYDSEASRADYVRRDAIPFDPTVRFMATLHPARSGGAIAYLKGAPEHLLAVATGQLGSDGSVAPLDRDFWSEQMERMADAGQRVLGLAYRRFPEDRHDLRRDALARDVVLIGLVGLLDPPREEAVAAVAECQAAGIVVKMITGDHARTAAAIARHIGLARPEAVATGAELDRIDDAALRRFAVETTVFARTSPEHKLRIVEALQAEGLVVAMTGDGVNDAPALKRADVGVAMGRKGTEAAKEAAEMVLADDNFASIAAAVREGRTVYDNLRKVVGWTLPTNGGEAFVIIAAILFGLTLPVTPVQILWINMITAVALGLTLAFEPTEPDTMRRPPRRPGEPLLSPLLLWRIGFVSMLFVAFAFAAFFHALEDGRPLEEARTVVVNTIVVLEIASLFSMRYLHAPSLSRRGVKGTPAVLLGVGVVVAAQLLVTYLPPLNALLGTAPIALGEIAAVAASGVGLFAILELEKLVRRRWRIAGT
ncbi:HAD family hydrolase [Rhizobiales bacterium L72]|uniref:HAD family hydrolase n=1 Tax=Propylenella binzhouense TaxID=2555902 RepID=A0A964T5L6_9HYPH|nr:HAD family hydrolase [Propylenella binzhouense]